MLGTQPIEAILGSGVDSSDHDAMRAFVRTACAEGLSLLLILPNSKQPADMRTPRQKTADNKAAREQAKADGRRDWDKVKSASGLALASSDAKTVLKYLDRYCAVFSEWADENGTCGYDAKREKAGEITIINPIPVNLAVEVGGSGIVVIDCDTREQVARWIEVSEAPAGIAPTVISPGQQNAEGAWVHKDGGHFWFKVPDEVMPVIPRNSGAMTWGGEHGFAVLWDRRYVLIPPSIRPEGKYELTGRIYDLPQWLYDAIAEHGQHRAERSQGNREAFAAGDGALSEAIDAWAETISWADILEPLGWAPAPRSDGCGCPVWTAPGLHASPKSATAHDPGCSLGRYTEVNCPLHIWTDNPGEPFDRWLAEEKTPTLSKLQAVALADYDNNIGKAMDQLGLAPDIGVGADFGVGAPSEIDTGDDVSMANLREDWLAENTISDGYEPAEAAFNASQDGTVDDTSCPGCGAEVDQKHANDCPEWAAQRRETPFDKPAPSRNFAKVDDGGPIEAGISPPDPKTGKPQADLSAKQQQVVDTVIADGGYTEAEHGEPEKYEPTDDPFDMAGVPARKRETKAKAKVKGESPYADEVEEPDPDVFESGITGVPRIAPFSHWRDLPPPEYIIEGLIEHGGLSCIIGPPNVGKSTIALDMACHIATGRRWQGRQTLKTKVMYMPGEGLSGAIQRLIAWCDAHGYAEADVSENLLLADSILQLGASNEAWAEFGAYVARQRVGLIIFDTFARMSLRLEENSATDVGLAVARFDRVKQLTNAGVMVIHHTAKGADFARGSSALNGAMDSELLVKAGDWDTSSLTDDDGRLPGKPVQLSTSKQKNAEQLDEPLPLILRSWEIPDTDGDTAALIVGPSGKVDPMSGEIVMARPTPEPIVETAVRVREFVDRFPQQGASRAELVIGVRPDPYALSRADAGNYWKLRISEAVDRALRYQLIETLTGTPAGQRYIPSAGTVADARQKSADEIINQDGSRD